MKKAEFDDVSGPLPSGSSDKKVEHYIFLAMSGNFAGVYKVDRVKEKTTFSYYDKEGNLLWTKNISEQMWPDVTISYDGRVIAVTNGNRHWSLEEESVGVDKNINMLRFYNPKGEILSEYGGFRNLSIGKLSDDGQFYAAIIWWSKDIGQSENKLIYIRTKDGKVLWERPFPGYITVSGGNEYDLAISEKGFYTAVATTGNPDKGIQPEVHVFDVMGNFLKRIKSRDVSYIYENGFVDAGYLLDISKPKYLGFFFLPVSQKKEIWEDPRTFMKPDSPLFSSYNTKDGFYIKHVDVNSGRIKVIKIRRGK